MTGRRQFGEYLVNILMHFFPFLKDTETFKPSLYISVGLVPFLTTLISREGLAYDSILSAELPRGDQSNHQQRCEGITSTFHFPGAKGAQKEHQEL